MTDWLESIAKELGYYWNTEPPPQVPPKPQCSAIAGTKQRCSHPVFSTTYRYRTYRLAGLLPNAETRCVHHLTDDEREIIDRAVENTERRNIAAFHIDPACWSWPLPDLTMVPDGQTSVSAAWCLLERWHAGRCAVCGESRSYLYRDHDHVTGLVRGLLCGACNGRESRQGGTGCVYDRYRSRPPTAILNLAIRYVSPITGPDMGYDNRPTGRNALDGIGL